MRILSILAFFPLSVFAEGAANPAAPSPWGQGILLGSFIVVFYLMIWRPQSKRAKEQRNLLSSLNKGDEVVTTGGICGRIAKLSDAFLLLDLGNGLEVPVQKSAITQVLPKGTLKNI